MRGDAHRAIKTGANNFAAHARAPVAVHAHGVGKKLRHQRRTRRRAGRSHRQTISHVALAPSREVGDGHGVFRVLLRIELNARIGAGRVIISRQERFAGKHREERVQL